MTQNIDGVCLRLRGRPSKSLAGHSIIFWSTSRSRDRCPLPAASLARICRTFPCRAESPREGQCPTVPSGYEHSPRGACSMPRAIGRTIALLPSGGGMSGHGASDEFFDLTAVGVLLAAVSARSFAKLRSDKIGPSASEEVSRQHRCSRSATSSVAAGASRAARSIDVMARERWLSWRFLCRSRAGRRQTEHATIPLRQPSAG
jgi:hypothetical protein